MSIHYYKKRPTEAAVTAVDAELASAMRKIGATPEEMIMVDAEHPDQAYEAMERLGAKSNLLGIIGSFKDTMDDRWVLNNLRRWNMRSDK